MIGLLLVLPLAGFALEALLGAGSFRPLGQAWLCSAALGTGAAAAALLLGIPAGAYLASTRCRIARTLTLLPLLLPPVLAAAAWRAAGFPVPGVPAAALLLGGLYWPLVAFAVEAALRRIPASRLEAAALHGVALRRLLVPELRGPAGTAALLVFALAVSEFTLPATFILPSLSMLIYEEMSAFRYASAAAAALPLLGLVGVLAFRLRLPASAPGRDHEFLPGRRALPAALAAWALTAVAPLVLFALVLRSPAAAFKAAVPALDGLAASAAVAAAVAALLVAWAWTAPLRRSRLEPFWFASLVLPGVVTGFGALALDARLGGFAPPLVLLVLALAARFAYAAWLPLRAPIDPAPLEAAALAGLSPARAWWRLVRPASAGRAAAVGAVVFILCLGELGPAVLLAPPGARSLVQFVFNGMHYGYDEAVAAACLLSAALVAAASGIAGYAGRRAQA